MRISALASFILAAGLATAQVAQKPVKSSGKYITKKRLAFYIDSVMDLETASAADFELLNYYSSLLIQNKCDSAMVCENLEELNFYPAKDEKFLFPVTPCDKLPKEQNIVIESGYLSFYHAPITGVVTSHYGWREGKIHKGIDIDLNKGDKVVAAFSGKVRLARAQGGYGNVVIIMHPNGLETVYAHLSRIKVKAGDIVLSGQTVGLGGSTGHSSGSHLHFEIRYQGYALNPGAIVNFNEKKLYHHTITVRNQNKGLFALPSNCSTHKVNKGESWYTIANRYGLSLKELMALNGVSRRVMLKAGQQVRIH
jgi:murein DD-endopeptidase MepM/ murein hydrolase activator NlpD